MAHILSEDRNVVTDDMNRGMHFELESHLKEITIRYKVEFIFLEV